MNLPASVPAWSVAGRRVVVTGATNGIGLAAAEALAQRGANLTLVGRSGARAAEAAARVQAAGGAGTPPDVMIADLSSQAEVRRLAAGLLERYRRIDVLVNNAGAILTTRRLTVDGIEATWALNHLAPFLLTNLLLDRLKQNPPARIITTSSDAHRRAQIPFDDLDAERSYPRRGFSRYGETKLANVLFTAQLASFLEGSGVTANCFYPGMVATGFGRGNGRLSNLALATIRPFARSPEKGAETLVWLADSPDVAGESGGYFVDRRRTAPSAAGRDMAGALRLWEVSRQQTAERPAA